MSGTWRPTAVVARGLGIGEADASTVIVTLVVATVLTVIGLPPVLRGDASPPASTALGSVASAAPRVDATPAAGAADQAVGSEPAGSRPAVALGDRGPVPAAASSDGDTGAREEAPSIAAGPPAPASGSVDVFARVSSAMPHGLVVVPDGTVFVATTSRVLAFGPDGASAGSYPVTGRSDADEHGLTGLVVDAAGSLLVLDAATDTVLRLDSSNRAQSVYAQLIDLPACPLVVAAPAECELGVSDDAPYPIAAALDSDGRLLVADRGQGVVWEIPPGGGPATVWFTSMNLTLPDAIGGLTFDRGGDVLLVSPQTFDAASPGGGAVYRIPVGPTGEAEDPEILATLPPGQGPAGIVALADGSVVLALRDADAIVLLDADGTETVRVSGGESGALDAPTGLALHGMTLLATNQAPDAPERRAVLAVGLAF